MVDACEMSPLSSPKSPLPQDMIPVQIDQNKAGQEQMVTGNMCLSGGSFIDNYATTDMNMATEDHSQGINRESPRSSHLEIKALPTPRRGSPILVPSPKSLSPKPSSPNLVQNKPTTAEVSQQKPPTSPSSSSDFARKNSNKIPLINLTPISSLKYDGKSSTKEAHPSTLPTTLDQVLPQDLSTDIKKYPQSYSYSKRRFSSPCPVELQMNFNNLPRKHSLTQGSTCSIQEDSEDTDIRGIKREAEDEIMCIDLPKRTFGGLPVVNDTRILDILKQKIKIPDSTCPELLPIPQSVIGINFSKNVKLEENIHNMHGLKISKVPSASETEKSGCSLQSVSQDPTDVNFFDSLSLRKQREFTPDNRKDHHYWDRRRRNNEAARRSREKRRFNDIILEQRIVELYQENHCLKAQLAAIKDKLGIDAEALVDKEEVMRTMPKLEHIFAINKCTKLAQSNNLGNMINPMKEDAQSPNAISNTIETGAGLIQSLFSPPVVFKTEPLPFFQVEKSSEISQSHIPSPVTNEVYKPVPLNLSIRRSSSTSPTLQHQEYSSSDSELARNSPISDSGCSLPHKLRHKARLSESDGCLSPQCFKPVVQYMETEETLRNQDHPGNRFTYSSEYMHRSGRWSPIVEDLSQKQKINEDSTMKSEIERLASELAAIKTLLHNKPQTDCDNSKKQM